MRLALVLTLAGAMLIAPAAHAEWISLFVHPGAARAVLLHPAIFRYLHTELPERQPFLISDQNLLTNEADLDLPFKALIVRAGDKRLRDAFQFTGAEREEPDKLVVTFTYRPEGITGRVTLRQDKRVWHVLDHHLVEH